MNELPEAGSDDELDARYRGASESDPSRPGEAVRHAILVHAAEQARAHAGSRRASVAATRTHAVPRRPAAAWRWPAIVGTIAAAALAGLTVLPHLHPAATRPSPSIVAQAPPPAAEIAPAPTWPPAPAAESGLPAAAPLARSAARVAAAPALPAAAPPPPPEAMRPTGARAETRGGAAVAADAADAAGSATALRHAAEAGDLDAARSLLDAHGPIDARDADGRSALWLAAFHGHQEVVTLLLSRGADPNIADRSGTTPRRAAELGGHPKIAAELGDAGARTVH